MPKSANRERIDRELERTRAEIEELRAVLRKRGVGK
jgi:hypothetical protein